jgi:DNA ligase-1
MAEYLQLCHKVKPGVNYTGWLVSEKLDGQRAWWDGGISRGKKKSAIPWANCLKDGRFVNDQVATGLWSRLGNVIHAPNWWLDQLPPIMLDGELWSGYEHRQDLMTAIKGNEPTFKVKGNAIGYHIYDSPPPSVILNQRTCNVGGGRKLTIPYAVNWGDYIRGCSSADTLLQRLVFAQDNIKYNNHVHMHQQLSYDPMTIGLMLDKVLERGGEGLILSNPHSKYVTERSHNRLKLKPFEDGDGVVIGWTSGAETDKGSRLVGKLGSLRLRLDNLKTLDLSGFTDAERQLSEGDEFLATKQPGTYFELDHLERVAGFNQGVKVSFKCRGLTADGVPMEARYWRKREDE